MAFETGTATSTFDLMNKLSAFMANAQGWTLWSDIGPYDKVYYSTGSDGYNAIYIRQRIGAVEEFLQGSDQYDYGNGDTGFLNFQSYVSFPQGGDAYAGASEIGNIGPRIFYYSGSNSGFRLWRQDVLGAKPGGSPHIIYGTPAGADSPGATTRDPYTQYRNRWSVQKRIPGTGSSYYHNHNKFAYDSHRNLYVSDHNASNTGQANVFKYSMRRGGGFYNADGTVDTGAGIAQTGWKIYYCTYAEDRRSRRQYVFVAGSNSVANTYL